MLKYELLMVGSREFLPPLSSGEDKFAKIAAAPMSMSYGRSTVGILLLDCGIFPYCKRGRHSAKKPNHHIRVPESEPKHSPEHRPHIPLFVQNRASWISNFQTEEIKMAVRLPQPNPGSEHNRDDIGRTMVRGKENIRFFIHSQSTL